jgi:glucose/arabinose dehydrogenase
MKNILKLGLLTAATLACSVHAQQPAWKQGMPDSMATSTLAPHAAKLTATKAADIDLSRLKLPAGFKIEVWADSVPGVRAIAQGDNGKYYAGTRPLGRVYEITDAGGQRSARVLVDKLDQPAVAYKDGNLIVMAVDKVLLFKGIHQNPQVAPEDITARFNLPPQKHHNWKYIAFGPDGKLYVPFGAPCNICQLPSPEYAQIRRYNPDGSGMEVLATGVRNTVGFDWHPTTKELWFTNHGRDWMGDDTPHDTLHRLKVGGNYGFPFCHQGNLPDPDIRKDNACSGVEQPVALMGPHASNMGAKFYTGSMFPAEYRNALFVARKGSWNRNTKIGFDVVVVRADADGKNAKVEPFLTGFLNPADQTFSGRPAYLHQMNDGSMLVADEQAGVVYRVSYAK